MRLIKKLTKWFWRIVWTLAVLLTLLMAIFDVEMYLQTGELGWIAPFLLLVIFGGINAWVTYPDVWGSEENA